MPTRWKIFRVICIMQMILAGLMAGYALIYVMISRSGWAILDFICLTAITLFANLGLSMIQNNYPDTLLSDRQKRYFNILYLVNFFLISFLCAHIYDEWRAIIPLLVLGFGFSLLTKLLICFNLILYLFVTFFQLRILYGMFRMRRELYANYMQLVNKLGDNA